MATYYYSSESTGNYETVANVYSVGAHMTVGQTGHITEIGVYVYYNLIAVNIKIAVYDSFHNLLGSGVVVNPSTGSWASVSGLNIAVSLNDQVEVWLLGSADSIDIYRANTGTMYYQATDYASFPLATLSPSSQSNKLLTTRVLVEAAVASNPRRNPFSRPFSGSLGGCL